MAEIIVIGGGAAGMMAAYTAASAGASVTLLERNEKLGKKVYITGKGRCNVTNDCTRDEFLAQVPRNPRFLYSALAAFSPQDMMALLEKAGCPVTVQRGRRVFPASEKASDVTRAFERLLRESGVRVRLNTRVAEILTAEGRVTGVQCADGARLPAEAVILCAGGTSYPATGSTGDGDRMAAALGHTVEPRQGVLVGLETAEDWPSRLQGLSLKNVTLTLKKGKKTLYSELGEMLFTHFGISGPLVLEMSCHLPEPLADARVTLNLKPGLTAEQLENRLQRDLGESPRKQLDHVLPQLLPARLAELFPALCGLDGSRACKTINTQERRKLAEALQDLPLTVTAPRPVDEAIVTRGGVSVREVGPGTMASKLIPGLYIAGEQLDVDAHTGGYNLQIAWSTGALAGKSGAEENN